jgi:serine/threonine protein kinase
LQKCVDKDPARRWSCEQLLRHSYFDNFHFKIPESELEEFEKLRKLRNRSRVSRKKALSEVVPGILLMYFKKRDNLPLLQYFTGRWKSVQNSSPFQTADYKHVLESQAACVCPLFKILSSALQILIA